MPASIIRAMKLSEELEGPRVATIFVLFISEPWVRCCGGTFLPGQTVMHRLQKANSKVRRMTGSTSGDDVALIRPPPVVGRPTRHRSFRQTGGNNGRPVEKYNPVFSVLAVLSLTGFNRTCSKKVRLLRIMFTGSGFPYKCSGSGNCPVKKNNRQAGRSLMSEAKRGDNVKVHYTGRLEDGTVFDSSSGKEPLEFTVGSGQVIAGFDEAVAGMKVGDSKTVHIPVEKAYGERNDEMVIQAPLEQVPPDLKPELGMRLEMGGVNGEILRVVVTEITETHITLDANPPLAGKNLIFDVNLVECVTL
jgi:peptidylprolyl isomerase